MLAGSKTNAAIMTAGLFFFGPASSAFSLDLEMPLQRRRTVSESGSTALPSPFAASSDPKASIKLPSHLLSDPSVPIADRNSPSLGLPPQPVRLENARFGQIPTTASPEKGAVQSFAVSQEALLSGLPANRDAEDPAPEAMKKILRTAAASSALGDRTQALAQVEAAVRGWPNEAQAHLAKARILFGLGRFPESERVASRAESAAKTRNTRAEAYALLSLAWAKQGRLDEARRAADSSRNLALGDSFKALAFQASAFVCERGGDRGCLLEFLRSAAEIDSSFEDAARRARSGGAVFYPAALDPFHLEPPPVAGKPKDLAWGRWIFAVPGLFVLCGIVILIRELRREEEDALL